MRQRQLRAIVRTVYADSSPDPDFPFAAQARRLVYMTVQS
jgi:hypothetical protein